MNVQSESFTRVLQLVFTITSNYFLKKNGMGPLKGQLWGRDRLYKIR